MRGSIDHNAARPKPYEARYRDPEGRSRSRSFRTKREAERFLADVIAGMQRGAWVDPRGGRTIYGELAQAVFADAEPLLARTTVAKRQSCYRTNVEPTFADLPLTAITASRLRAWVAALSQEKGADTVHLAMQLLRQVFAAAIEDGLLPADPSHAVKLPKIRRGEIRVLTPDDVSALLKAFPGEYELLPLLAYTCGLRWEEAAGLHLPDLDMLRREVRVYRVLEEVGGKIELRAYPKSDAGRRTVPFTALTGERLARAIRARNIGPNGELCLGPRGGWLSRTNFGHRVFKRAAIKAELAEPVPTFHDLRHAFATELLAGGLDMKSVSALLGHSTTRMTERYVHVAQGLAERLETAQARSVSAALA